MKIAVYQPYFFPYLGYWQLFDAVDVFVVLDDVDYIKRGFINRNSILVNGCPHRFTIPIEKQSQNRLINETKLSFSMEERRCFLKTITMAYKKAPLYDSFFPLLEEIVLFDEYDLTNFIRNSFDKVIEYLGLETTLILSSEIEKDNTLKGENRIIEINKRLQSDCYINAIGGKSLYDRMNFAREGIELRFLNTLPYDYKQFHGEFVSNLSIIDALMFNDLSQMKELLTRYELV